MGKYIEVKIYKKVLIFEQKYFDPPLVFDVDINSSIGEINFPSIF